MQLLLSLHYPPEIQRAEEGEEETGNCEQGKRGRKSRRVAGVSPLKGLDMKEAPYKEVIIYPNI